MYWVAMWNGFMIGRDGLAPYYRRFEAHAPYRQFPFGALVLFHPHQPAPERSSGPVVHEKLQPKLVPAVIVEITLGPAGIWADVWFNPSECFYLGEASINNHDQKVV